MERGQRVRPRRRGRQAGRQAGRQGLTRMAGRSIHDRRQSETMVAHDEPESLHRRLSAKLLLPRASRYVCRWISFDPRRSFAHPVSWNRDCEADNPNAVL
eukprot:767102-Hanusia_phi.AAC.4